MKAHQRQELRINQAVYLWQCERRDLLDRSVLPAYPKARSFDIRSEGSAPEGNTAQQLDPLLSLCRR